MHACALTRTRRSSSMFTGKARPQHITEAWHAEHTLGISHARLKPALSSQVLSAFRKDLLLNCSWRAGCSSDINPTSLGWVQFLCLIVACLGSFVSSGSSDSKMPASSDPEALIGFAAFRGTSRDFGVLLSFILFWARKGGLFGLQL